MRKRYNKDDYIYEKEFSLDDFVPKSQEVLQEFICYLCKGVHIDPLFDACGHLFCSKCINYYMTRHDYCPITKKSYPVKMVAPIPLIKEFISRQIVKCMNRRDGCNWEGPLRLYNEHVYKQCSKLRVNCFNTDCKVKLLREDLAKHLGECPFRLTQCTNCNECFIFKELDKHYSSCPEIIIDCPQKCGKKFLRKKLKKHYETECENTELPCPYVKLGCLVRKQKKYLNEHVQASNIPHLLLASKYFGKIRKEILKEADGFVEKKMNEYNTKEVFDFIKKKITRVLGMGKHTTSLVFREGAINPSLFNSNIQKKTIFDEKNISKGIQVSGNIAKCLDYPPPSKHQFLFVDVDPSLMEGDVTFTWGVSLHMNSNWLGFGLCDKEQVLKNHMSFPLEEKNLTNHGLFIFTLDGYKWNANLKFHEKKKN